MIRKKACWRPLCSDEGVFLVEDVGGWLCVEHYRRVAHLQTPRVLIYSCKITTRPRLGPVGQIAAISAMPTKHVETTCPYCLRRGWHTRTIAYAGAAPMYKCSACRKEHHKETRPDIG